MTLASRLRAHATSASNYRDGSRLLDAMLVLLSTPVFGPLIAFASVLIVLDDQGSPLFFQQRVGRDGTRFSVVKLRTMNGAGVVTRVGRWLRPTGIDEVPQLVHVLLGQMSLVGPRPLAPADLERLSRSDAEFGQRLRVRPGITGLVQVRGGRSARHCGKLERLYARRRTTLSDVSLLGLSVAINVVGRHRVRGWLRSTCTRVSARVWSQA